jgi:hypothetical protein
MYFEKEIKRNPCVLERCLQAKEIQKEWNFMFFIKHVLKNVTPN